MLHKMILKRSVMLPHNVFDLHHDWFDTYKTWAPWMLITIFFAPQCLFYFDSPPSDLFFYFWHENAINASPQLSKPNYLQEKYSDNRIGLGARIIFRRPIAVRYLKINSTVSGLAHDRKPFFSCQMDDSYVVSSNWYTNPSSWTDSTRMAERCQIASQLIGSLCNGIYDVEPEVILKLCTNSNRSCSWSNLKKCALWVSKEGRWSKFTST